MSYIPTVWNGGDVISSDRLNKIEAGLEEACQLNIKNVVAESVPAGSGASATLTDGVLTINIPQGAPGEDGENGTATDEQVATAINAWCTANITDDPTVVVDASLSVSGAAADAAATGAVKADLQDTRNQIGYAVDITDQFSFTNGKVVYYSTGKLSNTSVGAYSNYVAIPDGYSKIRIMMIRQNDTTNRGVAFYTAVDQTTYISGIKHNMDLTMANWTAEERIIDVPEGAKYFRTNWFGTNYAPYNDYTFKCELLKIGEIEQRIAALENKAEGLAAEDVAENIHAGMVKYYSSNEPYTMIGVPGATDSSRMGVTRIGNRVILNGETPSSNCYFRFSGIPSRTNSSSTVSGWTTGGITLITGHIYRVMLKIVNGDPLAGSGLSLMVCAAGTNSTVGAARYFDNYYVREFTAAADTTYHIILYATKNLSFENYALDVTLIDCTDIEETNKYVEMINQNRTQNNWMDGLVDYCVKDLQAVYVGSGNATLVSIERTNNIYTLNGTANASYTIFAKISNGIQRNTGSSDVKNWTNPLTLKVGHRYMAMLRALNGGYFLDKVSISVYRAGESSTVGYHCLCGDTWCRMFTADTENYHLCLYIAKGSSFDNEKYEILLVDRDELEGANLFIREHRIGLEAIDERLNNEQRQINYGYNDYMSLYKSNDDTDTTTHQISIERSFNEFILNGATRNSDAQFVRLNGTMATTLTNTDIDSWTNGVPLQIGHQYRLTLKQLPGGTFTTSTSSVGITVSIYRVGQHATVGTYDYTGDMTEGNFVYHRYFTADVAAYHLVMYLSTGKTFDNVRVLITLEDVTDGTPEDNRRELMNVNGDNLVPANLFVSASNVTYSTDVETGDITITNGSTASWNCLQTSETWALCNLVPGGRYRLYAKAEKVSGNPYMVVGIRGKQDNAQGLSALVEFGNADGERYVDFIADEYMKRVSIFLSFNNNTNGSVAKFNVWVKPYETTGMIADVSNNLSKLMDLPEESLMSASDFATSATTGTTLSIDSENNSVTVTNTGTSNYSNVKTSPSFITRLVPGKRYRVHVKADVVSGTPNLNLGLYGTPSGVDTLQFRLPLVNGHEAFTDFVATEYNNRFSLFMSFGAVTQPCVATFSEIWLKEYNRTDTTLTTVGVPADAAAVGDEIKARTIYETKENISMLEAKDGADNAVVDAMKIKIKARQSNQVWPGTPTFASSYLIRGFDGARIVKTGKNLCGGIALRDSIKRAVPNATIDETNKTITFAGNATGNTATEVYGSFVGPMSCKFKPGVYTFILTFKNTAAKGSNMLISYADKSYTMIPAATAAQTKETIVFNSASWKTVARLEKYYQSASTVLYYDESGVFEGTLTAADFEPYYNEDVIIDWSSTAGTVYGGTLDVAAGTLTVDWTLLTFDGTETWTLDGSGDNVRFICDIGYCGMFDESRVSEALFSHGLFGDISANTTTAGCMLLNNLTDDAAQFIVRPEDVNGMSVETFTGMLANSNIMVTVPITTPIVYNVGAQKIKTTFGINTIYSDVGNIEQISYPVDPKMYVDNKVGTAQKLMELIVTANRETGMAATKNYSAGDLMIVDGTLYKATASIASGSTLTVGSNVTATTVAAELA